ncbi:hypothetical protein V8C86DRAFT_3027736 [Haematococcus lacustris]
MRCLLWAVLVLLVLTRPASCAESLAGRLSAGEQAHVLSGKVYTPAPAATLVKLFTADGQELQSFVQSDGSFEFEQVPPGSHLLQPFHISYFYPEVKVDVSPKAGLVRATQLGQPKPMPLPTPLQLRPLGELQYYEKRKPVDVWSIVKSPYGLMIVFSLFFIFVMPMLKVDPEEMKEAQAAMRGVLGGSSSATEQPAQQRITGASR